MTQHATPVSRVLSIACKMVKTQSPGMRLLVSLADPQQQHHGGIYQAAGWVYVGRSSAVRQYQWSGKWRNDSPLMRMLRDNPELRKSLPCRDLVGKHKYLMPLDDEIRARIAPLAKPYPKRAGSADSGTPGIQPGRGGATPTSALDGGG